MVNDFKCACLAGTFGKTCNNETQECASQPCKNGATCQDLENDYNCTCQAGWTGKKCEDDVNECVPNPCQKGTCEDGLNKYICKCQEKNENLWRKFTNNSKLSLIYLSGKSN